MGDSRYSHAVGAGMNRVFCSGVAEWSSVLRLMASAALIAGTGMICAQALTQTTEKRIVVAAIPQVESHAVPSYVLPSFVSNSALSASLDAARFKTSDGFGFSLPRTQFPAQSAGYFQSYRGFQSVGADFAGSDQTAGRTFRFGGSRPVGIAGKAELGFAGSTLGTSASPNFNQMMRAKVAPPFGSSVGTFKLGYRDVSVPGAYGTGSNFGQGTSGGLFTTTNLGNGVFFSAGTNVGRGPTAGTPPGGNIGAAGPKPSRPAVSLKLSF